LPRRSNTSNNCRACLRAIWIDHLLRFGEPVTIHRPTLDITVRWSCIGSDDDPQWAYERALYPYIAPGGSEILCIGGKSGEMGDSLKCALFRGPPRAVRAYFEQHAARGGHVSRPDRLPLSSGLASTGSPASRDKNRTVQAVALLSLLSRSTGARGTFPRLPGRPRGTVFPQRVQRWGAAAAL